MLYVELVIGASDSRNCGYAKNSLVYVKLNVCSYVSCNLFLGNKSSSLKSGKKCVSVFNYLYCVLCKDYLIIIL